MSTKQWKDKELNRLLMEKWGYFKEGAKPDYIDLDKDGDKEEPMKKAAQDAKQKGDADEDELEEGAHEEDELEEEFDQEAFVSEVVARVHARLSKEGREEAAVDQLAERIIQRIKEQSSK